MADNNLGAGFGVEILVQANVGPGIFSKEVGANHFANIVVISADPAKNGISPNTNGSLFGQVAN